MYVLDRTVAGNIEDTCMFLEMWIWLLIHDTLICQMTEQMYVNEHAFHYYDAHEQVVRQQK
jgi:hypothetical protein